MSIVKLRELGVMIDCSRNAVVKLSALKEFIKLCSKLGYDYVGLYTEDTIDMTAWFLKRPPGDSDKEKLCCYKDNSCQEDSAGN